MKPLGRKHQKTLPGHQKCATCHGPTKAGRAAEKRKAWIEGWNDACDAIADAFDVYGCSSSGSIRACRREVKP